MYKQIGCGLAAVFLFSAAPVAADEPFELSAPQLDSVAAGTFDDLTRRVLGTLQDLDAIRGFLPDDDFGLGDVFSPESETSAPKSKLTGMDLGSGRFSLGSFADGVRSLSSTGLGSGR